MTRAEPAAKALVVRDGRQFFLEHARDTGPAWGLPGGRVEGGEHQRETVRRELREETSLDVTVGDALGAYTFRRDGGARQVVATAYACTDGGGTVDVTDDPAGGSITDHRWVTPAERASLALDDELTRLLERVGR